jgi:hypothetical protein
MPSMRYPRRFEVGGENGGNRGGDVGRRASRSALRARDSSASNFRKATARGLEEAVGDVELILLTESGVPGARQAVVVDE